MLNDDQLTEEDLKNMITYTDTEKPVPIEWAIRYRTETASALKAELPYISPAHQTEKLENYERLKREIARLTQPQHEMYR